MHWLGIHCPVAVGCAAGLLPRIRLCGAGLSGANQQQTVERSAASLVRQIELSIFIAFIIPVQMYCNILSFLDSITVLHVFIFF